MFEIDCASLNVDPMLVMMALEAETAEELSLVLDEVERQEDTARAAKDYLEMRNTK